MWDNFGCMYIIAFASISSNRNRGSFDSEELPSSKWYGCRSRVGSYAFMGKGFESKWRLYKFLWLKPICFSEYSKHILELWNALKPFTRPSARKQSRHNQNFGGRQSSHSHAWMTPRASKSTRKQVISARVRLGATDWTRPKRRENHIIRLWVISLIYSIKFCSVSSPKNSLLRSRFLGCHASVTWRRRLLYIGPYRKTLSLKIYWLCLNLVTWKIFFLESHQVW